MKQFLLGIFLFLIGLSNVYGQTPLMIACEKGDFEAVKNMVESGVNIDSILVPAIADVNHDSVHVCFGHQYMRTALYWAVVREREEIVLYLLENGANINKKNVHGETVLHASVKAGNKPMVELLLSKGVDCKLKDDHGNTAYQIAEFYNHKMVLELFNEDCKQ